jgi:CBS domain-containing protein
MATQRVEEWMTRDVVTLQRNDQLLIADQVMQLGRIRHMPVLDEDDELVGVLSQRDLFRGALVRALGYGTVAQQRLMKTIPVKEVMTTQILTARPDESLASAARRMLEHKIGCLPVVEDGKLIGILTEADFVSAIARDDSAT